MKASFLFLLFTLSQNVLAVVGEDEKACPFLDSSLEESKYHGDHTCNRAGFNEFKHSLNRHQTYQRLMKEHKQVPLQQTNICPINVESMYQPNQVSGFDTIWHVENTSRSPVVLTYMNPETGKEYSAMNAKVLAHEDPDAVILPGKHRAIHTYEGSVFYARELLPGGGLGRVVMQHRVGLVPVGANFDASLCPTLDDPEPVRNNTVFARTQPAVNKRCHQMDIGFRNQAGCPIHGYFVSQGDCKEHFKLHLGVNDNPSDFMNEWSSPTKFEGTFVSHAFVFRLAADPSVLVDSVTVRPTHIVDCPEQGQAVGEGVYANYVAIPTGRFEYIGDAANVTSFNSTDFAPAYTESSKMHTAVLTAAYSA